MPCHSKAYNTPGSDSCEGALTASEPGGGGSAPRRELRAGAATQRAKARLIDAGVHGARGGPQCVRVPHTPLGRILRRFAVGGGAPHPPAAAPERFRARTVRAVAYLCYQLAISHG